jgi:hypothetical protein
MFGRNKKEQNQAPDPRLQMYATVAGHLVGKQLIVLEQVADRRQIEGPLTPADARKDIRFRGDAYANRGFLTPDGMRDAFVSYMNGERFDTSKGSADSRIKVVGPVHTLEMQGGYQQAEPENGIPTTVRFQIAADLGNGAIKLIQQTEQAGQKKPVVEHLQGEDAWERAMPLINNLPAVLEATDPALGAPEELPLPPTLLLEMNQDKLETLFEQIDREQNPQNYPPQQ